MPLLLLAVIVIAMAKLPRRVTRLAGFSWLAGVDDADVLQKMFCRKKMLVSLHTATRIRQTFFASLDLFSAAVPEQQSSNHSKASQSHCHIKLSIDPTREARDATLLEEGRMRMPGRCQQSPASSRCVDRLRR
jgi:hypothetical protein